jgi:hypothetical protein
MKREQAAFVCSHVLENSRPVLLVSRDGGDWQFLCGSNHDGDEPSLIHASHLFERDQSLRELQDLPANWDASRTTKDEPWLRFPTPPEDESPSVNWSRE